MAFDGQGWRVWNRQYSKDGFVGKRQKKTWDQKRMREYERVLGMVTQREKSARQWKERFFTQESGVYIYE